MDAIIKCTNITKKYSATSTGGFLDDVIILNKVTFVAERNSMVAIIGSSGCGKSTLLNIIGLLDCQTEGELEIDGESINISKLNQIEICRIRNQKIGFVFQSHNLLPELTAEMNIALPLLVRGESKANALKRARDLLEELFTPEELGTNIGRRPPAKLSGGQCQRIAIARALVGNPSIILADEPTGNLDESSADRVFSLLIDLQQRKKLSIVLVTHNLLQAKKIEKCFGISHGVLSPVPPKEILI